MFHQFTTIAFELNKKKQKQHCKIIAMPGTITDLLSWFPLKRMIELHYPFTQEHFKSLESTFDFKIISRNTQIKWDKTILESFENKLCWESLSNNPSVRWDKEAIFRYENRISWNNAIHHPDFDWTKELFMKYIHLYDFTNIYRIPVELEESDLDCIPLSQISTICNVENLPWSEALIEKYEDHFQWYLLSSNPGIPFSKDLFWKYFDNWDHRILLNSNRLVSTSFISKFLPFMYNHSLRMAHLEEYINLSFLKYYFEGFFWQDLSSNKHLPWDQGILEKYEEHWHWNEMSVNTSVPWTWSLIERYEDQWNWCGDDDGDEYSIYCSMSANPALPWSKSFLERFGHHMKFGEGWEIGDNHSLIRAGISGQRAVDWDIDFLLKYKHQWEIESLGNNTAIYTMIEKLVGREQILNLYRVVS